MNTCSSHRVLRHTCPTSSKVTTNALFAVMQPDLPRMWREIFPEMLAHLEGAGALTITVTETEVVVSSAKVPKTAVYRVERTRTRTLH